MLSPLSRGFGTWTGNYDPYNEDGADSDSLPDIEEPHRHGITVGFVSRTPSATLVSPPFRTTSSHVREATLSASTHYAREATLSGKRNGSGREVLFADPMSRENSDSQMNLPKTFLTRKGALMLFAADEDELDSLPSKTDVHPRLMRIRKPVDVIDTSLKLGTMDKLTMSVLQFGEEEALKENSSVTDDKNKLFMKFLNKVDDRDVDKRAQPGGDVKYYLSDLKHKTSLQMGLSRDTALPRSREALELRAILRGLQEDGSWPMTYRQAGADFKRPSGLAEQFSRPASHLHHPPRNQNQRILSSDKLEDSVKSLRSYLGRSLDTLNENGVPLLTRRRAKHREGDVDSVKRSKYAREPTDEDFRRHRSHRPHTNTPTRDQDIHGDDEESRDKLGEIIDPRLPRDDRGRIEMIEIPHPTTPRSTDIATEDKLSPRAKSESSSKLGEKIEEDHGPETLVSITEDKFVQKKAELPTIPDYLKPKPQSKPQSKPQAKKDQKKKGQLTKGKKEDKTAKTPVDVTKAIDITSVQPEEQDEITQIIKKKVTLPPEIEQSIMPDFVTEAINRSKERSKQQLEEEFAEKQRMIEKEIGVTSYEGEGMTAEELELEKKELKKREELAKEKILKGKPQKKMDEKSKKSGGSSSIRSKKSKGGAKDPLQLEKERIRALKEQEKLQRMEEIRALEEKIAAQSNSMSADDKKFKDKLQTDNEVQMELERIEREAYMAEQTEADVRQALREERMKRMEEKAKLKKEELARKRQQLIDRKQQEKQLKEEARQRELQKIMMLMDDEERKKRQEEERLKKEEDEKEEENKRKEMEEEFARQEREEEERRRQLEEEIEQEELRRIQVEQDEIRKQQEVVQAQKEALLEEQRRKRELAALEEQRHVEELDRKQQEELKRQAEERARINELLQLEEEVRERMKQDTEKRREEAIQRRDTNIDAKSNLNKIRHSQGINRAFVFSYFINWPMETYMRPVGEQEKKKKEAKLREKRKKAR
ncbi:golgin subfamily A member 6-like protein 22 isoform X4 [Mytilus californianus]|uniref:golgin subfamily A member 6-like protein 22 isoform X4 n=1 Tax=Mytilus californianus TaxID=6549 RepID=UPI0022456BEE|nr:golgin subfamily A member 6-like protein 22 isoform X4 [Mytilus californianus]